jgi:hypothetical protein
MMLRLIWGLDTHSRMILPWKALVTISLRYSMLHKTMPTVNNSITKINLHHKDPLYAPAECHLKGSSYFTAAALFSISNVRNMHLLAFPPSSSTAPAAALE